MASVGMHSGVAAGSPPGLDRGELLMPVEGAGDVTSDECDEPRGTEHHDEGHG